MIETVVSVRTSFFQPKLAPLSESVIQCIKELNDKGINATLEVIHRNVQLKSDSISDRPGRDAVISCLKSLFREKKIQFGPNRGYSLTSASPFDTTCKERQSTSSDSIHPVIPQSRGPHNLPPHSDPNSGPSSDPACHSESLYRVETPASNVRILSPPPPSSSFRLSSPEMPSSPESHRIHSHLRTIPCIMHRDQQRYHTLPSRVRLHREPASAGEISDSAGLSNGRKSLTPVARLSDTRSQCLIHRRDQRYSTLPPKAKLSPEYNEESPHAKGTTTPATRASASESAAIGVRNREKDKSGAGAKKSGPSMLKKLLQRWGIAHRSPSRRVDIRKGGTSGKTASLASPEPSSCSSSSETCSFSSVSSFNAENSAESGTKIRNNKGKKISNAVGGGGVFASSPISLTPSSCVKQFREMQTQTDPLGKTSACVCNYCEIPFGRSNADSCPCCPAAFPAVLPYLHPNQISTCCSGFDPAAGVRMMPATRFPFPLCSQSLSVCYGPCLGPAPPPVHGHHLPMTFSQQQPPPSHQHQGGCVVRRLDPRLAHRTSQSTGSAFD